MSATHRWPKELRLLTGRQTLKVTFDDGEAADLPAELLRVHSPSAEVQGHGAETRRVLFDKQDVKIQRIEPVGSYAVRLIFDDGHDTGYYTWAFLDEFARTVREKRTAYDAEKALSADALQVAHAAS
ncbi:MAG: gamma-butyrobetaine hydroxylase-like domain-containing protein [Pseudomonadota bacterium]